MRASPPHTGGAAKISWYHSFAMASGKHSRKNERTQRAPLVGLAGVVALAVAAAGFVLVLWNHSRRHRRARRLRLPP